MQKSTSNPPDLFADCRLRDPILNDQSRSGSWVSHQITRSSSNSTSMPLSSSNRADSYGTGTLTSSGPDGANVVASSPTVDATLTTEDPIAPKDDTSEKSSDSDTDMADAMSSFAEAPEENGGLERELNDRAPNWFRLLDLVDEHGSGGIVEKIVIDQNSLHRLLNIVQPGSYDSVSKINFKALDKLSIQATGLYGTRSEIIKHLKKFHFLTDDAALFLHNRGGATTEPSQTLRSGLYLVLQPKTGTQPDSVKNAYIVYWPEETTWDDQAASSYLTKLAEQVIALVSSAQASSIIWDTGARNKDLPADQMDNDDESRLFSFEVSKSLEQEEDAIASTGFTVRADSKYFPQNVTEVCLVPGEQKAALLVSVKEPSRLDHRPIGENINQMRLRKAIESTAPPIQLGDLVPEDLMILANNGLRDKHPRPFEKYDQCMFSEKNARTRAESLDTKKIDDRIRRDIPAIQQEVQSIIRRLYDQVYPSLNIGIDVSINVEKSAILRSRYSAFDRVESAIKQRYKLDRIVDNRFQRLKSKWILLRDYLTADPVPAERDQADFVNDVLNASDDKHVPKSPSKDTGHRLYGLMSSFKSVIIGSSSNEQSKPKSSVTSKALADPAFVEQLPLLQASFPVLDELTKRIYESLEANLLQLEDKILPDFVEKITSTERKHQLDAASQARTFNFRDERDRAFETLISDLREAMDTKASDVIWVESVKKMTYGAGQWSSQYRWSGTHVIRRSAQTRHCIYPLDLTEQDSQQCRANEAHVPTPKVESRHKFEFTLAEGRKIEFLQLVRDKCLVIVSGNDRSYIYIEDVIRLDQSINGKSAKITLHHDSLGGPRCLFAFDQTTRLLAIVHGGKELKLSVYICDEIFTGLRSRGSPIPLKNWYDPNVQIDKICFVSGSEEVCLVELSGRIRIFSLITQQFRTASIQTGLPVVDAFSAPDGSCLFVAVADQSSKAPRHKLLAFHWASFGSNQAGIHSTHLPPSDSARVITRFEGRGRSHVISFSAATHSITSVALQVKQKATEFSFRSNRGGSQAATAETFNNSLIDCHFEVWTRFPVVPAVARSTLSPVNRQPRKLAFQSSVTLTELKDYFARMISTFERTTRKPMDGTLSSISVFSTPDGEASLSDGISEFLLGSFIVELLCLIPLHLAITRENRFIPLKDGVWEPSYERSLLGADVPAIIDALSLGWYESIFQSYMATRPVRVVSSMGEQSVGKSYCLNHFADTSFAGSAMRTTEGVWLSCTPTESYLLVSLDFEGVHSIERSAQEDALLVLFNTAISNLVLFRNNFALSRDIAGLFTSFQSSAMVLDPNANRGLFNSTLAIIIKDVTNSDANDIVKEFSLKFQKIVEKEQDQNFISRLHRGRIQIIPWPVINSPSFYSLFRHLRQQLDKQSFTHGSGGAFLHNLKTLMAKIKASDWGALDQNLAAHRAQQLLDRLSNALCYGRTEEGALKNMDTDEELTSRHKNVKFFVPNLSEGSSSEDDASLEESLRNLVLIYGSTAGIRHRVVDATYVQALQELIYESLDDRVDLVRRWATANTERFPPKNQDIRNLIAKTNAAALAMRAAVRICSVTCSECQLLCLRSYRHTDRHDCGTTHDCPFDCAISEEHEEREHCGLPAGHGGTHMCNVKSHSCGNECHLSKMGGCARSCVKPPFHEGDHLCSARSHLCGKPCDLQNATQRYQHGIYSCPGMCNAPWDEPHTRHACENSRACPIECVLCRRLCCSTDHFHGLDSKVIHLCGQEHNCASLCDAEGICQIETRPSAIQEQFSGRHEAFQYTRYSQVDRRLSCVVPIPPGELSHDGEHTHSTDADVFHFCDARCPNCEYLCTLPLGHPQQLHETSHGSMTATKWVVEGDDANPVYELQGRKFGSGDEGAPMLCSLVCAAQGRHAHIDYCRDPNNCDDPECEHISERMHPDPDRPKDWISHSLSWARSGFKDPYSQDEQLEFAKCDVLCAGPEHEATATTAANPSYCTLPIFHDPQAQQPIPAMGHVSMDGHSFDCQNPSRLHQAYHIVFVIDSSGSMTCSDRVPLPNTPISARLTASCNNRYGAVLSALHSFWLSRESAASSSSTQMRQDAYSVVTFYDYATTRVANDFASSTDQLITQLIPQLGCGGTNFHEALIQAQGLIESHWSSDRAPVIVFLSDGECNIGDNTVYDLCRMCVRLGKALAFYSVSFGTDAYSASLRQMANIAHEVYASAPQDVLSVARGNPCAYTNAIDSIQLADTFLGIASSLQKPRASLIGNSGGRRAIY